MSMDSATIHRRMSMQGPPGGMEMRGQIPLMTAAEFCSPLARQDIPSDEAETLATLFKALGDPSRVRIVNLLATSEEPICVCNFTGPLGLSQGTVSFHLKKLRASGLLGREHGRPGP